MKVEGEDPLDEEEEMLIDGQIERASDDENDEDYGEKSSKRKRKNKVVDEEVNESDIEDDSS